MLSHQVCFLFQDRFDTAQRGDIAGLRVTTGCQEAIVTILQSPSPQHSSRFEPIGQIMAFHEMVREKLFDNWVLRFGPSQQRMRFAFLDTAMGNRHVLFVYRPGLIGHCFATQAAFRMA
ncbi:MAG: hypothetical protein JNL58_32880 [Planctomyces sp.]|nr:hypothetical protein [Planctomyces sp.]